MKKTKPTKLNICDHGVPLKKECFLCGRNNLSTDKDVMRAVPTKQISFCANCPHTPSHQEGECRYCKDYSKPTKQTEALTKKEIKEIAGFYTFLDKRECVLSDEKVDKILILFSQKKAQWQREMVEEVIGEDEKVLNLGDTYAQHRNQLRNEQRNLLDQLKPKI